MNLKKIKEGIYERIWREEREGKLCNCVIISKNKKVINKNSQDIKKRGLGNLQFDEAFSKRTQHI